MNKQTFTELLETIDSIAFCSKDLSQLDNIKIIITKEELSIIQKSLEASKVIVDNIKS